MLIQKKTNDTNHNYRSAVTTLKQCSTTKINERGTSVATATKRIPEGILGIATQRNANGTNKWV
jgi:hypothetical protein